MFVFVIYQLVLRKTIIDDDIDLAIGAGNRNVHNMTFVRSQES
jgi:hypothetical protein